MKNYLSLIKFSHTIFALPFAIIGFFLALRSTNATFDIKLFLLMLVCMVTARSAAMAFNRYIDRHIDIQNPRTKNREIPAGIINANTALFYVIFNSALFILATYFMSKIQMKTLIIVNRLVLINQWVEVLHKFIKDPKISIMKPNQIIDWDNDFFIVNAINIAKFGYMPEIGLVVVDELHLIVSRVLSNCFQYLTTNYLIGLSATPYRPDGLDVLINLYFGEERIDRQLFKKHHVYVINTNFTPIINKNNNNSIDWNDILNQQSQNEERNKLIINCILRENYNFLVLCKRVEHIKYIGNKLRELDESKNINIQCLYNESQPNTNVDETQKQVIIGTIQKIGTGFDFPCLNALIIAADIEEYFIQYLGRIFRKQHECIPVVFDFVDNNSILQKHFKTRKKTYQKHGGTISIYSTTLSKKDI